MPGLLPWEVARDYRARGRYDLALACVAGLETPQAAAEAARALVRLGRAREAVLEIGRAHV